MKISRLSLLAFLLLSVVGFNHSTVLACSCREFSACEAFNFSSAVFIGRPISASRQRELPSGRIELFGDVVFEVLESFSGTSGRTVTAGASPDGLCGGRTFTPGTLYLIYASEAQDKALWINTCSRTRVLDHSWLISELNANTESERWRKYLLEKIKEYEDELAFLRNVASGKINRGRIFGKITKSVNYLENRENRGPELVFGVVVKIEGEGYSATTQANESGTFSFEGLNPGIYFVSATPPEGYQPSRSEWGSLPVPS